MAGAWPQFFSVVDGLLAQAVSEVAFRSSSTFEALPGLVQAVVEARGVVRDRALQGVGHVERERHGQPDQDRSGHDPHPALPGPERPHPFGHPPPGQRERQQRDGRADGEGQGQRDGGGPDPAGRAGHRDRGQHRARAGHVDGAQSQPEHEAAAGPGPTRRCGIQVNGRSSRSCTRGTIIADADQDEHDQARPSG